MILKTFSNHELDSLKVINNFNFNFDKDYYFIDEIDPGYTKISIEMMLENKTFFLQNAQYFELNKLELEKAIEIFEKINTFRRLPNRNALFKITEYLKKLLEKNYIDIDDMHECIDFEKEFLILDTLDNLSNYKLPLKPYVKNVVIPPLKKINNFKKIYFE